MCVLATALTRRLCVRACSSSHKETLGACLQQRSQTECVCVCAHCSSHEEILRVLATALTKAGLSMTSANVHESIFPCVTVVAHPDLSQKHKKIAQHENTLVVERFLGGGAWQARMENMKTNVFFTCVAGTENK